MGCVFNDPKNSKVAGDIGLVKAPKGSGGKRTGWSGSHTFSITEACENKQAAASFITFLTSYEGQILEARRGLLPTRERVWQDIIEANRAMNNDFMVQVFKTYQQSMAEDAFTPPLIPEWIEVSNQI